MEPVDPPTNPDDLSAPPVGWVSDPLGAPLASASVDALRAVLARHRRRQRVLAVLGLAVVLVAGTVGGFAIGQQGRSSPATRVAAADQPTRPPSGAAPGPAPVPGTATPDGGGSFSSSGSSSPSTQLLVRTSTDGVRVRLYEQAFSKPACAAPNTTCAQPPMPSCIPSQLLNAEVSDDQVAGQMGRPVWQTPSTSGLESLGSGVVGFGEPQPMLVVVAHVGADVATVDLSTPYGTDTETPTSTGWVALAVQLPADYEPSSTSSVATGTLTARSSSGATVSSTPLEQGNTKAPPAACVAPQPVCVSGSLSTGGTATTTAIPCATCKAMMAADAAAGKAVVSCSASDAPSTDQSSGGGATGKSPDEPSTGGSSGAASSSGSSGAASSSASTGGATTSGSTGGGTTSGSTEAPSSSAASSSVPTTLSRP